MSDDHYIIEINHDTLSYKALITAFTKKAGLFETDNAPYYRPLHRSSYLVDKYFFGLRPLGYHAVNITLHALTVCLLYVLLLRLGCDPFASFCSALLFGLHPVNAETVNFIAARNDTLAAVFVLAAFLASLSAEENRRPSSYALSGALFFMGMLSKETAVMFLPFFFFFKVFRDKPWRNLRTILSWDVTILLAPVLCTALYIVLRSLAVDDDHLLKQLAGVSGRLKQLPFIISTYASLLVAPVKLNFLYTVTPEQSFMLPSIAATGLCLAMLIAYGILRKSHLIAVGLAWCVINFFPISNILLLPSAPMAERYLYMPLIGISMIVAALLQYLRYRTGNWRVPAILALAAVIPLGILTAHRNLTWKNDLTVVRALVEANPTSATDHFEYGLESYRYGDIVTARKEFERSLHLDQAFPQASWAYYYLGTLSAEANRMEEALHSLKQAVSSYPGNAAAQYALAVLLTHKSAVDSLDYWKSFNRQASLPSYPLLLEAQNRISSTANAEGRNMLGLYPQNMQRETESPDWKLFYRYKTGTLFYYDPSSVFNNGIDVNVITAQQLVRGDARLYASRIIRFALNSVSTIRFSLTINCKQRLFKTTGIEFRDDKKSILGTIYPDMEGIVLFEYIPPDTPIRKLSDMVCSTS